jgi:hypothetical protein
MLASKIKPCKTIIASMQNREPQTNKQRQQQQQQQQTTRSTSTTTTTRTIMRKGKTCLTEI